MRLDSVWGHNSFPFSCLRFCVWNKIYLARTHSFGKKQTKKNTKLGLLGSEGLVVFGFGLKGVVLVQK